MAAEVPPDPDPGRDPRPEVETFECDGCDGCLVTIVESGAILDDARVRPVELLHGAAFPPPVRRVELWVTGARWRAGYEATATITTGGAAILGSDPLGVMLARRLASGDPFTARVVAGLDAAATEVARRLGLPRPAGPATSGAPAGGGPPDDDRPAGDRPRVVVREVAYAGLRATVTQRKVPAGPLAGGGRHIVIRAEITRGDDAGAAGLRAMCCLVLRVVAGLTGRRALAGRRYLVSRHPADRATGGDSAAVRLDDVGGLDPVVAQFRQVAVSFRHPGAMARWGARRPQGILLYGPPGTGKTMLARALANEIGAAFREIRTPEILDKWLGASERNIKRIFREARRYREPTLLLFDEFDTIIGYAGEGGDAASHAVNAVAGIFKQEMNTLIEANPNVIVVATTNFPHRVDESLVRSGRFDIRIEVPPPDAAARAEIITKMVRQLAARHEVPGFRMFADDLDPGALAAESTGMTGADLREVLRRAQLDKAMQEARTGAAAEPIGQGDLLRRIAELRR